MYSPTLLAHFYHLEHAGCLPSADNVRTAAVGEVQQGDLIQLTIAITADIIERARFECYGGVVTLAACEYFCRWLEGKSIAEALTFNREALLAALDLTPLHIHTADRLQQLLVKIA